MENFKRIKEDLVGILITLGENSLSDKEKIKECDKLILDTIKSIDLIINLEEKKELYEDIAYDLLMKKHHAAGVTNQEYRDGDVWFLVMILTAKAWFLWRVCAKFFPRHRTKPMFYEGFLAKANY